MPTVQLLAAQQVLQRVAEYARLSDDDAKDPELRGENVAIQLDECANFRTTRSDWQHVASFHDNDISASSYSSEAREDFDKLMALVRASGVDVILCIEVTQPFRKPLEAEQLIDLVWSKQTSFHAVVTTRGGYYDLRTSVGRKALRDAVNTAAGESDNISDRVRSKKAAQARQGLPNGGPRAYGFEPDGITHVPHEREVWLEARRRILQGEGPRWIVVDFNERGIPTTHGKKWQWETLARLMKSPRYMGKREHRGVLYDAVWDGFVTPEEWEELQLCLRLKQRFTNINGAPYKYLLRGFAVCGKCGLKLYGKRKCDPRETVPKPRYYCKHLNDDGSRRGCGGVLRLAEPLEDFVTEAILYRFDSEDFARALAEVRTT
ncbi:recombinase family protein [Kitasatospora misakiensis]|uniref:Recombinase family protein n=1 Tax=Kitasatospora misakiensis TaxID=67330 RepID=A0ABW0X4Y7_9ACTN